MLWIKYQLKYANKNKGKQTISFLIKKPRPIIFNYGFIAVDCDRKETKLSPSQYLAYDMDRKLITAITLKPLDSTYKFISYKVMVMLSEVWNY